MVVCCCTLSISSFCRHACLPPEEGYALPVTMPRVVFRFIQQVSDQAVVEGCTSRGACCAPHSLGLPPPLWFRVICMANKRIESFVPTYLAWVPRRRRRRRLPPPFPFSTLPTRNLNRPNLLSVCYLVSCVSCVLCGSVQEKLRGKQQVSSPAGRLAKLCDFGISCKVLRFCFC